MLGQGMPDHRPGAPIDQLAPAPAGPPFDPALLAVLVCPLTKTPLLYVEASGDAPAHLVSIAGRLRYPIDGGVPVLLLSEASALSDAEIDAARELSAGSAISGA